MFFVRLFQKKGASSAPSPHLPVALEALEGRVLFSSNPVTQFVDPFGRLIVSGSEGSDAVTVRVYSNGDTMSASVHSGRGKPSVFGGLTGLEISGLGGNDKLTILASPDFVQPYYGMQLLGGNGHDLLISSSDAYFEGGSGNDRMIAIGGDVGSYFYGGDGANSAFGGKGDDTYYVSTSADAVDVFDGGSGDDKMIVPSLAQDLAEVYFNGGKGFDLLIDWRSLGSSSFANIHLRHVEDVVGLGKLSIESDPENPALAIVLAGSEDVVANVFSVQAQREDIWLERVSLHLRDARPSDLNEVTIWDGDVLVGRGVFVNGSTTSTIHLQNRILLTKDVAKRLTVKVALQEVGINQPGTEGVVIKVDVVSAEGSGMYSGARIYSSGISVASGIKMYKAFPKFALEQLSSVGVADGRLLRFKVKAIGGSIGINRFTLNIHAVGANVEAVNIYAFTDPAFSMPISGLSVDGTLHRKELAPDAQGFVEVSVEDQAGQPTALQISEGVTIYFEVRAGVFPTSLNASVVTTLLGDGGFPLLPTGFMGTVSVVDTQMFNRFIWSPNTRRASFVTDMDWTNGFLITGLPSIGLVQSRSF